MIGIPETFTRSTVEREAALGVAWIVELPTIVDDLLDRWERTPDGEVDEPTMKRGLIRAGRLAPGLCRRGFCDQSVSRHGDLARRCVRELLLTAPDAQCSATSRDRWTPNTTRG